MRYVVHTDGGSRGNPGLAGYGVVIADASGGILLEISEYLGTATNNEAEYLAVIGALEAIGEVDGQARVEVNADSKLVVEQLKGSWKIKKPELQALALRARRALPLGNVTYRWVPRASNAAADALANKAMDARSSFRSGSLLPASLPASPPASPPTLPPASSPTSSLASPPSSSSRATAQPSPAVRSRQRDRGRALTLVFVRHGVTEMTERGAFSGGSVAGPPLSRTGREQAGRAAAILAHLTDTWPDLPAPHTMWVSPMLRTVQTAGIIGKELGVPVQEVSDLRETDFGELEGLTAREIEALYPGMLARWRGDLEFVPPGGSSLAETAERVTAVARLALEEHAGRTVVLVTHSVVTKLALGQLCGIASPMDVRIPPASISVARLWPEGAELVAAGLPSEVIEASGGPLLLF